MYRVFTYVMIVLLFMFIACVADDCRALERKLETLSAKVDCLYLVREKGETK